MDTLKKKNDYSVTVYLNRQKVLFTQYVHSIYYYVNWLKFKGINWDYILVYVRRSRLPLCYYKNGDYIDSFPNYEVRGRIKEGW